jgi:hypothetical protein
LTSPQRGGRPGPEKEHHLATKKNTKNQAKDAAERVGEPGAWRVVLPFAGAALAALGSALALGGKAIRDRREQSSRKPGLAVIPIGGLLAIIGAIAWRNRERVLEIAGEAVATAESLAARVTGQASWDESDTTESAAADFGYPAAVQGSPAA